MRSFPLYRAGAIDLYRTRAGWRWRLVSRARPGARRGPGGNGRIIAASSEAFASPHGALRNIKLTASLLGSRAGRDAERLAHGPTRRNLLVGWLTEQGDLFEADPRATP